jgi:mono/diheme cytochrome c family protein
MAKNVLLFLGLLIAGLSCGILRVQAASDGLYTADQAKRGGAIYAEQCASCHGNSLEGMGQAPPLTGHEFLNNYNGIPIAVLFDKINKSMPATNPGSLTRPQTADIVAFILSSNKYPTGATELTNDAEALKKIQLNTP